MWLLFLTIHKWTMNFQIFFPFIYLFISWRLITLQYCSGFCHTLTWISKGETQMYRTDFWTLWEKARVGCFKRTASKHVYYLGWNRSPAQVGCMRQVLGPGALKTQRDQVEREMGGWIGMGNTCISMADSCRCMTKTTIIL